MHYGIQPEPETVPTIRVRMLRTDKAIPFAGSYEVTYLEGHEYDLPDWLAEAYFRDGFADPAEAHVQPSGEALSGGENQPSQSGIAETPSASASKIRARRGK